MKNQKVSIIIPAYKPQWFEECLSSAINQSYSNLEIIICDDSENDEIQNIINRIDNEFKNKIKYEKNLTQLGEVANFEKCVDKASGTYIKPLYDDDVILKSECVEIMVNYFESIDDICVITTSRINIDKNGKKIIPQPAVFDSLFNRDVIINGKDLVSSFVYSHLNYLGEPSCSMFRKKDFISIESGAFNFGEKIIHGIGDLLIYSNLIIKTNQNLLLISEPMTGFRSHPHSTSNQLINDKSILESQKEFRKQIIKNGHFKNTKSIYAKEINGKSFYFDFIDLKQKENYKENLTFAFDLYDTNHDKEHINSLSILKGIQNRIKERHFHNGISSLYDIRTTIGSEKIANYLEIGSYVGHSASLMLEHPFKTNVYCIDPLNLDKSHFNGTASQYDTFCKNMDFYLDDVHLFRGFSTDKDIIDSVRSFSIKFDILFIDGDHRYEGVIADFINFQELVLQGGYIIFDDYEDAEYSPDVRLAVNDIVKWIKNNSEKFEILGQIKYRNLINPDSSNLFVLKKLK